MKTAQAKRVRERARGFTLIELLVVVAIVGILAAIAIPQYAAYRARGYNARISSDSRNAATSEEAYFIDNDAYFAGTCTGLPGFTLSGGVTCTAAKVTCADGSPGFTVTATHAQATRKPCVWSSCPAAGSANLVCG